MKTHLDFGQTALDATGGTLNIVMDGLRIAPLFLDMDEKVLGQIAAKAHEKTYGEGDVLCHQDDVAHTVWLVLSGWVKLTRETLDGAEAVWDVLGQGHVVGLETLASPYVHTTRAVAVGEVSVLAIPHSVLRVLLESSPDFARKVLGFVLRQQQDEHLDMEHRAHQTAPQRIGCFLLRLAGTPESGKVVMNLPFDKGLLAARLGMQPETFSRALAKLKQETGMTMVGPHVEMDIARMEMFACGQCSGTYPCK